jgi:hypothetical protein
MRNFRSSLNQLRSRWHKSRPNRRRAGALQGVNLTGSSELQFTLAQKLYAVAQLSGALKLKALCRSTHFRF